MLDGRAGAEARRHGVSTHWTTKVSWAPGWVQAPAGAPAGAPLCAAHSAASAATAISPRMVLDMAAAGPSCGLRLVSPHAGGSCARPQDGHVVLTAGGRPDLVVHPASRSGVASARLLSARACSQVRGLAAGSARDVPAVAAQRARGQQCTEQRGLW